jgi:hypothetical protein
MKPSEYHACATGDCPHDTQDECVLAVLRHADELHAEVERLRAEVDAALRLCAIEAARG